MMAGEKKDIENLAFWYLRAFIGARNFCPIWAYSKI